MCCRTIACSLTFSAAVCQALLLLLAAAVESSLFPALAVEDSSFLAESAPAGCRQNAEGGDEAEAAGLCAVGDVCWVVCSGKACVSTERAVLKPESESVP